MRTSIDKVAKCVPFLGSLKQCVLGWCIGIERRVSLRWCSFLCWPTPANFARCQRTELFPLSLWQWRKEIVQLFDIPLMGHVDNATCRHWLAPAIPRWYLHLRFHLSRRFVQPGLLLRLASHQSVDFRWWLPVFHVWLRNRKCCNFFRSLGRFRGHQLLHELPPSLPSPAIAH